jgi:hypothetical protein
MRNFGNILLGLGFIAFGIVLFLIIEESSQKYDTELQRIHAGQVPPEILTVVSKYMYEGSQVTSHASPHVICSSSNQGNIHLPLPQKLYDTISPGDTVTGYYFPDGYVVPQWHRHDAGLARWLFLGLGVFLGAITLSAGLLRSGRHRELPNSVIGRKR